MLERLEQLEENIARLKLFRSQKSVEDIQKNPFDEWALRYGLFESIQIVIDLACHLVGKYNLGATKSYSECIERLERYGYIDQNLSKKLIAAIGLRNLLIHEYIKIDQEKLYSFLDHIDNFGAFIQSIESYI